MRASHDRERASAVQVPGARVGRRGRLMRPPGAHISRQVGSTEISLRHLVRAPSPRLGPASPGGRAPRFADGGAPGRGEDAPQGQAAPSGPPRLVQRRRGGPSARRSRARAAGAGRSRPRAHARPRPPPRPAPPRRPRGGPLARTLRVGLDAPILAAPRVRAPELRPRPPRRSRPRPVVVLPRVVPG